MKICIHRGTNEIGGSCIEIESQGKRIVLDIGLPLDADIDDTPLPDISGFDKPDNSLLGIFISHPHMDHYGLAEKLNSDVPILIGPAAKRIIEAAKKFIPSDIKFSSTIDLEHKKPIELGPFTLTPYLVDHSAYDAYAVLVEADGKRLFYSGDFRGHGRKGKLLNQLVRNPPKNVDVMLMEGSTLGRSGDEDTYPSESELEDKFCELFKSIKGMALVWCSGQNIDRLVTVYKACKRSGRQFIADMYTAHILQSIENPNLPQPIYDEFRVYLPWNQRRRIIMNKEFTLAKSFKGSRIHPEKLKTEANNSVMLFRPSMRKDLEKADCLENATLIYSLWSGYLKEEKSFLKWLEDKSIPLVHCHTSGHAPVSDLKRFAKAVNSKFLVPIHSFKPELYSDYFDKVKPKKDGEIWEVH